MRTAARVTISSFARFFVLVCLAFINTAHIGSPDAWFDGAAGPYRVTVHVQAPPVVPGIAIINIRPGSAITEASAFVNKYDAVAGNPPPVIATPVAGRPGWYRTQLWVMDPGSNSVTVSLKGALGQGTVVIPLVAVAGRRLEFDGVRSVVLAIAGLILVAGLLTIVGAAVRESVLQPGATPDPSRSKRARVAMIRGAAAVIVVVAGLGAWWRAEDSIFAQSLFKPLRATATVTRDSNRTPQLVFTIIDSAWTQRHIPRRARPRGGTEFTELMTDHGKLMHLFIVNESGAPAFAHLHPVTHDSVSFKSALPPLEAGRYRVFADILHATGLTQTLVSSIVVSPLDAAAANYVGADSLTGDEAWFEGASLNAGTSALLTDGSTVTWNHASEALVSVEEAGLRFSIAPPVGDTASLEPFLGMTGHAVVVRDDGGVFIQLHPSGTISMGAQYILSRAKRPVAASESLHGGMHNVAARPSENDLHFPYAFPSAGRYTVWLQVKRHGRILTSGFRVVVNDPAANNLR